MCHPHQQSNTYKDALIGGTSRQRKRQRAKLRKLKKKEKRTQIKINQEIKKLSKNILYFVDNLIKNKINKINFKINKTIKLIYQKSTLYILNQLKFSMLQILNNMNEILINLNKIYTPPFWSKKNIFLHENSTRFFDVKNNSSEYDYVYNQLLGGYKRDIKVNGIIRIENESQYNNYMNQKKKLNNTHNYKTVFYGSGKINPMELISEGWNFQYAKKGFYGLAQYFAENPEYSCNKNYAYRLSDNLIQIIILEILLGKTYMMHKHIDRDMKFNSNIDTIIGGPHYPRSSNLDNESSISMIYAQINPNLKFAKYIVTIEI